MNTADSIETILRKDRNALDRLLQANYIDPVLGAEQLDDLHNTFVSNIKARNRWQDKTAPKIAREMRTRFDPAMPHLIRSRISERDKRDFYLRFVKRLALADSPDRDQLAVDLGRDLFNQANLNGTRKQWFELGTKMLNAPGAKNLYAIETFGAQLRRMKSRMSGQYFGPYYDTTSYNLRIIDPRIQEYAKLERKIDVGLRVGVLNEKNRLRFRERSKTYWIKTRTGYVDTRIPITSTSSFSEFPEEFIDKNLVNALEWASKAKYKVDEDMYDFTHKLLYFKDDRG